MKLSVDMGWITATYLLSLRIGALVIMTPIFSNLSGMIAVRVLFTLALSAMLVSGLGFSPLISSMGLGALVAASVCELVVGAVLAFGVFAAFGAFSVAGKILDVQSGLGIGSVFDPVTRAGAPLFATILNLLAVVIFFSVNGHHALLRGIVFSTQQIPIGASFAGFSAEPLIRQFGLMFSFGVALIAPVMFVLFLIETGLAVIARTLPQMNVFVIGMPVKIVAAIAVFALSANALGHVASRVHASIFDYWERVLP
jgi:flagellar biosynthetic protein FliR